jgi:hypothetical protein
MEASEKLSQGRPKRVFLNIIKVKKYTEAKPRDFFTGDERAWF